jgi:proteasome lid subunit RPN8/RPN11
LRIPRALYDEIVAHALADENEVCGLVAGRDGEATRVLPVRNAAPHPARTYEMDPMDQHRAWSSIEDAGEDLLAIYHSHPPVGAYFSETDMKMAYTPDGEHLQWPGVLYIVVGLRPHEVKTFAIADHQATEVELQLV